MTPYWIGAVSPEAVVAGSVMVALLLLVDALASVRAHKSNPERLVP